MIWAGILSLILLALTMLSAHSADWPDCKFQCRANDVTVSRLWLGDDRGDDLFSAVPGERQSCYLWATFYNNANTPRYAAILLADLYINGTLSRSFYDDGLCVLDEIEAKSTMDYPLYNLIWTSGEEVQLKRLVLSWETARGTSCIQANRKCSNRNTKCYGGPEAESSAEMPLSAFFSQDLQECSGDVKFVDQTTGGAGPYAYDWDFGDGFHSAMMNPTHTYSSLGTYIVGLLARDRSGKVAFFSQPIIVSACPCTIVGQDYACLSKTEAYKVTLTSFIPGSIQWYLDGIKIDERGFREEPQSYESDEGGSIDIGWQDFGPGLHVLQVYVAGAKAGSSLKQRAACNMNITVIPEPMAIISWVV
ncbi:MAG: PKD domain-containing protein [Methanothrix sp.]|nr:PKD domain-containing protein [Methanothrix sp.]